MTCVDFSSADPLTSNFKPNQVKLERAAESKLTYVDVLKHLIERGSFAFISTFLSTIFPINAFLRVLEKDLNWFQPNVLYKSTLRGFHSAKTKLKAITLS